MTEARTAGERVWLLGQIIVNMIFPDLSGRLSFINWNGKHLTESHRKKMESQPTRNIRLRSIILNYKDINYLGSLSRYDECSVILNYDDIKLFENGIKD